MSQVMLHTFLLALIASCKDMAKAQHAQAFKPWCTETPVYSASLAPFFSLSIDILPLLCQHMYLQNVLCSQWS